VRRIRQRYMVEGRRAFVIASFTFTRLPSWRRTSICREGVVKRTKVPLENLVNTTTTPGTHPKYRTPNALRFHPTTFTLLQGPDHYAQV